LKQDIPTKATPDGGLLYDLSPKRIKEISTIPQVREAKANLQLEYDQVAQIYTHLRETYNMEDRHSFHNARHFVGELSKCLWDIKYSWAIGNWDKLNPANAKRSAVWREFPPWMEKHLDNWKYKAQ